MAREGGGVGDGDGVGRHAAETPGGGWALNQRGQGWKSQRVVLVVTGVVSQSRQPGPRLTRHRLR